MIAEPRVIVRPIEWGGPSEQMAKLGDRRWSVSRLFELSRDLPVFEVPLAGMDLYARLGPYTIREMAGHVRAVQNADLNYPIILDEDGCILDGRHRVIKAVTLEWHSIKAVRFDRNPIPCRIVQEGED